MEKRTARKVCVIFAEFECESGKEAGISAAFPEFYCGKRYYGCRTAREPFRAVVFTAAVLDVAVFAFASGTHLPFRRTQPIASL